MIVATRANHRQANDRWAKTESSIGSRCTELLPGGYPSMSVSVESGTWLLCTKAIAASSDRVSLRNSAAR